MILDRTLINPASGAVPVGPSPSAGTDLAVLLRAGTLGARVIEAARRAREWHVLGGTPADGWHEGPAARGGLSRS